MEWRAPTLIRFHALYGRFIAEGLTPSFAEKMATLAWWAEGYGLLLGTIVSGKRSARRQAELRRQWEACQRSANPSACLRRAGIAGRPAVRSKHTSGEAVDIGSDSPLDVYAAWAPLVGVRWAGTGDRNHFEEA